MHTRKRGHGHRKPGHGTARHGAVAALDGLLSVAELMIRQAKPGRDLVLCSFVRQRGRECRAVVYASIFSIYMK